MLVNADEINNILRVSGNAVNNKGKKYFEQGRVRISEFSKKSDTDYVAKSFVEGTYDYNVEIKKENGNIEYSCNCPSYSSGEGLPCKHVVAMTFDLYINEDKYLSFKKDESIKIEDNNFQTKLLRELYEKKDDSYKIIEYYEKLKIPKISNYEKVKIIPKLSLNFSKLELSFKIGTSRMYILKDLNEFSNAILTNSILKYGKELEFVANLNNFEENSRDIAKYISKKSVEYEEYSNLGNYSFTVQRRYKSNFRLNYGLLDDFFDLVQHSFKSIEIEDYDYSYPVIRFVESDPYFNINVMDKGEDGLLVEHLSEEYYIFDGQEYSYILYKDKLYRCSNDFKEKTIPFLKEFKNKRRDNIKISTSNATSFCEYVVPNLKQSCNVNLDENLLEKYRAEKLGTKIFLDIDNKNNIIAEVKFCYGDVEFNPFSEEKITCNRNIVEETLTKEILKKYNFNVNIKDKVIYLSNEEDIYNFLKDGINLFMEKFEVLVTDKLKNRQIISPKSLSIGVRIQNNLLELDISNLDFTDKEIVEIFNTYKLKKKYYRLKDGSYINLESSGIETLVNISNNLGITASQIAKKKIELPKYRAIYLDSLVKKDSEITMIKDKSFSNIIRDITEVSDTDFIEPDEIKKILRNYQVTGFKWLKTLEKYNFGGILADDMGLGKTIQVIALLIDAKNNNKSTSIVVCPSSLYINWQKEIEKFAPKIKTLIISGNAEEREVLIKKSNEYDVLITSYDLLKRDIEKYENTTFNYIIADEAQYIKNNNTKNSKALKKLKGNTRFALTGTPMENSLSELWSIFDFVMPGYLFGYKKFKEELEAPIIKEDSKEAMNRLQSLVAPFILRRIKKEVLKELPDKTETIMYSEMTKEQTKLYKAYLLKAKDELDFEIKSKGFESSQMKMLAVITRLRQLCCHPSLFIDNYNGESSKLNQCIELIEGAINSDHKILLFSQFTSMLEIIKKELNNRKIKYYTLTGQTKVDTRIDMVESFNKSKEVSVFLISLKAGGTGLNLTGADMVIHYDPWWNLSAQNQATDRAYRIGQRSNVQVFKLITENSIEEKIQKLQDKKINLTNSVIKEGENFINKMSKEDLLDLFEI